VAEGTAIILETEERERFDSLSFSGIIFGLQPPVWAMQAK
jgi:hypothetical protein